MRMSKMYFKTLREVPSEAEIPSHIWMLRAGLIKKLVSGVYGFMPLGWRSLKKIENIIREELDKIGAQEILMSALQPKELWVESGRWWDYGDELWRLKDRNTREFCLGPTHEEIFTDIIRNDIDSYRQLPINLYQIQTKYRDEQRPRFGLMRSREFIMKDAYTFDRDEEGLNKNYEIMNKVYTDIFNRIGLDFRPVEADNGAIGGSESHEFCALSEYGESELVFCKNCNFASTREQAKVIDSPNSDEEMKELEKVRTPDMKSIEEVAGFLGVKASETMKALLFRTMDKWVIAFIRGDRELNMTKLVNALKINNHEIEFADENEIYEETGAVAGFAGPFGLRNCMIVVDSEIENSRNLVSGATEIDHHYKNVNYGRDFKADLVADIKLAGAGEMCPECKNDLEIARGIEVGQIFKLGTKYSESMGAYYKDENMREHPMVMGCYGIGVTRTLAAVVEQNHDKDGIIWPFSVAPYHVIITLVNLRDENQTKMANELYEKLLAENIECMLDDRDERPGVKFKDADLLGIPVRVTIGKSAAEGKVEFKLRKEGETDLIEPEEAIKRIIDLVK